MKLGPLYLMRHGEPALAGRMLGHTNCDATPAGIAACRARAASLDVSALVSSDLARAQQCAAAIGTPSPDARWRELDFGGWDGRLASEIDPKALGAFWDDPDAYPPPDGERWSELVARVGAALRDLPQGPVLVVTHGGAMRAALHILCGFDLRATWAFDLPYAAMLAFNRWDGGAQLAGQWT